MRTTRRALTTLLTIACMIPALTACDRFGDGNDYIYGYYPIKDETIDNQTLSAHRGVDKLFDAINDSIEFKPKKRSLNKQYSDKQWFREEGLLTIACNVVDKKNLDGIPCDKQVNYILDWNVDTGNITGLLIDGHQIVDNADNNLIDNKIEN